MRLFYRVLKIGLIAEAVILCYSGLIYPQADQFRKVENTAFKEREALKFDVKWGSLKIGTAYMVVEKVIKYNGRSVFRIRTTAKSASFIDHFFKVRDKIVSHMDREGLFSWRLEKSIREGGYKKDELIILDHADSAVKDGDQVKPLEGYTQDILSAFYYFRSLDYKLGNTYKFPVYADGKIWEMEVKVHNKEQVEVPAGRFETVMVEPVMQGQGIFAQKGRIFIWLTDDRNKIPVKMVSKISIGSINAVLTKKIIKD